MKSEGRRMKQVGMTQVIGDEVQKMSRQKRLRKRNLSNDQSRYDLCACGKRKVRRAERCRACADRYNQIRQEAHGWALALLPVATKLLRGERLILRWPERQETSCCPTD